MIRARFRANGEDPRPVKFPPPHPFWISGYGVNSGGEVTEAIVIAFADNEAQIKEYWPEADEIDAEEVEEVTFTDRFPKPDWWKK